MTGFSRDGGKGFEANARGGAAERQRYGVPQPKAKTVISKWKSKVEQSEPRL